MPLRTRISAQRTDPPGSRRSVLAVEVYRPVERIDGSRECVGIGMPLRLLGVVNLLQVLLKCAGAATGEIDRMGGRAVVGAEPPGVFALMGIQHITQKSAHASSSGHSVQVLARFIDLGVQFDTPPSYSAVVSPWRETLGPPPCTVGLDRGGSVTSSPAAALPTVR